MSDFVDDYLDPVETKVDATAIPASVSTTRYIRAADVNKLSDYVSSLRTAVLGGKVHGLRAVTATPTGVSGISQLFMKSSSLRILEGTDTIGRALYLQTFNVKDYGAAGDGVTNDSTAIAACIAAAKAFAGGLVSLGARVLFPPGTYLVSSKVLLSECTGISLEGHGRGVSIIKPTSITTDAVVQLRNCNRCHVEDLSVLGETAHPPYALVEIRSETGHSGYLSTKNVVRNVDLGIAAGTIYAAGKGISVSGNVDSNNDFHLFENVFSYGATYADVAIDNSQSCGHVFFNCHLNGVDSGADYGVIAAATRDRAGDSALTPGGTFHWFKGSFGGHGVADFQPGLGPDICTVNGGSSEGSYRLVDTPFLPGVTCAMVIENVRFSSDTAQAADNIAIRYQYCGPLVVSNCRFDQSNGARYAKISLISASPFIAEIAGNQWNQPGSESLDMITMTAQLPSGSYPGAQFFVRHSNVFIDSNGVQHHKGNLLPEPIKAPTTVGTILDSGVPAHSKHRLDFGYALLTAGGSGTTENIAAFTIPAGYRLKSCIVKVTTPFAGTTTLTASVGTSGSPTAALLAGDMKAVAGTCYGLVDADKGASFTRAACEAGGYLPSMTTDTAIVLRFTSTGTNINTLTAGALRLFFTLEHVGD